MEGHAYEGMSTNNRGEQTSFGSEVNEPSTFSDTASSPSAARASGGVKAKISGLPALLADGLQAGAEALRQRRATSPSGSPSSVGALANDPTFAAVSDTLATGMQSSADWLRDADLDKLKEGVENQVKEHPARTLLVALGAGYLLGKAFRR